MFQIPVQIDQTAPIADAQQLSHSRKLVRDEPLLHLRLFPFDNTLG